MYNIMVVAASVCSSDAATSGGDLQSTEAVLSAQGMSIYALESVGTEPLLKVLGCLQSGKKGFNDGKYSKTY